MPGSGSDFVEIVKRLGRSREDGLADHPEPEVLLAYHRGELAAAEADRIEEHLTYCRACADLGLSIPAFLEAGGAAPSAEQVDSAWRALHREQGGDGSQGVLPKAASPAAANRSRRRLRALPQAAMLLLGLGGGILVHWLATSKPAPRASFRVVTTGSESGTARGGEEGELLLDFRTGAELVVAVLTPPEEVGSGPFEARVVDERGTVLVSEANVAPSRFGTFMLAAPRGSLPAGRLEAQVLDGSSSPPRLIARRWLRVLLPEPR